MPKRTDDDFGNSPDFDPSDENVKSYSSRDPNAFEQAELLTIDSNPAVNLSEVLSELGLGGENIPAENLKGKTFILRSARRFPSEFPNQEYAYFCVCVSEDGEAFTTVLGGLAVVPMIDGLILAGWNKPIRVTLEWKDKGANRSYYYLK